MPFRTSLRAFRHGILVGLAVLAVAGCSRGPETAPVEGVVTLDGKPLEGASVLFEPEIGARPAVGITDAAGKFTLTAYVGPNNIAVAKGLDLAAAAPPPAESKAEDKDAEDTEIGDDEGVGEEFVEDINDLETPVKYASARTSGFTIDVQQGMPPVTLELKSGE